MELIDLTVCLKQTPPANHYDSPAATDKHSILLLFDEEDIPSPPFNFGTLCVIHFSSVPEPIAVFIGLFRFLIIQMNGNKT